MIEAFDPAKASDALKRAVMDGMADMAFLDAEPRPAGGERYAGPWSFRAAIDALRPMSCRIELRSQGEFLARIMDILFEDPEQEGLEREDAVLEMLNVIAGTFLTEYFGSGAEIKLELPKFVFSADGAEGEEIVGLDFDAEGFPVRVCLSSIRYRY